MKLAAAVVFVFLATTPRQVEVRQGETLEDVARRELGDPAAASELRAFNALGAAQVKPGTKLKVPGKDRERAVSALGAAKKAIAQLDAGTAATEAQARLTQAEKLLAQAKYQEAAAAADEAWKLASVAAREGTTFTVEVDDAGGTRVTSRTGQPVRVEAQGVQKVVEPGATVKIVRGEKPPDPKFPPEAPALQLPTDRAQLKLRPNNKGELGPVRLSWKATRGATSYVVEVLPVAEGQEPLVLTASSPTLVLPPLTRGKYWWKVKAVGDEKLVSRASDARMFELAEDQLKLEVRGTDWK